MSFWDAPLAGVVIGGLISTATSGAMQFWGDVREARRSTRASKEKSAAEWNSLQMRTIFTLQDEIRILVTEAAAAINESAPGDALHKVGGTFTIAQMNTLSLCCRLDDDGLVGQVREYVSGVVALAAGSKNSSEARELFPAVSARHIKLQERFGEKIKELHKRPI